ncbi:MAG TPA: FliM/FliN family flagellar motor switch protein [Bryobacteraceae bacterium]|jgi:flagellar motor switch protein FliN/FliY|nr:FliM/FliN family flagellar motor switch protein [Bryobacteraceae bacterium]
MESSNSAVDQLLEHWTEQFRGVVAAMTGETPLAAISRTQLAPVYDTHEVLWWQQAFSGNGEFQTWIGAQEDVSLAIGRALGGREKETCRSTYLELLGKISVGTAEAVSSDVLTILCGSGEVSSEPNAESLVWATVSISLNGTDNLELTIVVELQKAARVLERLAPAEAVTDSGEDNVAMESPMLERLREMELPLSIAVGSAELTIRDVLATEPGRVIDLDKEIGDTVELFVHNTLVARGEIVEVKGNYGLRIKQIVSRGERLRLCPGKVA